MTWCLLTLSLRNILQLNQLMNMSRAVISWPSTKYVRIVIIIFFLYRWIYAVTCCWVISWSAYHCMHCLILITEILYALLLVLECWYPFRYVWFLLQNWRMCLSVLLLERLQSCRNWRPLCMANVIFFSFLFLKLYIPNFVCSNLI